VTRARRRLFAALGTAAAALLVGRLVATVFADYAWYAALGAESLWWVKATDTVLLRGSAWLLGTLFIFANLYAVRGSVLKLVVPRRVANLEIDAEVSSRSLVAAAALAAAGVGALLTLAQDDWTTLALARVARPFGEQEFFLERDLAAWTAWLPLERAWYTWAQATLIVGACLVVALYALTPGLRWERGALRAAAYVRRHLAVLGSLLLLLLAWGYGIERQLTLVNGPSAGGDLAPGLLTSLLALSILTAACALLVLWAGFSGQMRLAFAGVTTVIVSAILLQHVIPATLRWMERPANPDKLSWSPGSTRAQFTRRAYAVQQIVRPADDGASLRFAEPAALLGRVSLWSPAAVRAAVELGGWRRELVGGIGWRGTPAGLVAIAAARTVAPDSAASWVAVEVEASRPASDAAAAVPALRTRPLPPVLVHPGAVGYQVVPPDARDVAAPHLGGGWRRLAHALAVQNPRLFLDRPEVAGARLLRHHDVAERVHRLAPVFQQGAPAVPLLAGDSLYWAVHLYSSARTYPLSVPMSIGGVPTKYFRHAAVAIVNAHTGLVALVPVRDPEPLAAAWMARFPALFADRRAVPTELLAMLPPPMDAVRAQVLGMILSGGLPSGDGEAPLPVRLPIPWASDSLGGDDRDAPFLAADDDRAPAYAIPLLGEGDDRPRALVIATGGASPRTRVVPLDSGGPEWAGLLGRLRAGTAAVGGAGPVVAGPLQMLPARGGGFFLQPLYAWRTDGLPALAQVALAVGDSVRRAPTLEALVAPAPGSALVPTGAAGDPAALYGAMRDALRRGDWTAFGAAFEALGRALAAPPPP
jgi:uncharacterized membrane protein (UPF0182 family)